MEIVKFKLKGVTPLIMHKDTLANPLHPATKAHKAVSKKARKTDEDHEWLALSEWRSSIYHDSDLGPYVPGVAIEAMLAESAKMQKLGKTIKRAVMVQEDQCALQYDGPRDLETLSRTNDFIDVRSVRVTTSKLMRTRPIFKGWELEATVLYDQEHIDREDIVRTMDNAGKLIGLLEYRPRFGRFVARTL